MSDYTHKMLRNIREELGAMHTEMRNEVHTLRKEVHRLTLEVEKLQEELELPTFEEAVRQHRIQEAIRS